MAFLLFNHTRLRVVARLFGIGPEQANLVTAIAILTLAETMRRKVRALMEGPILPAYEDGLVGGAVLRELLGGMAGLSTRDTPQPATLLTVAVVSGLAAPTAVKSIRSVKATTHRASIAFHHRYGYLIDPGHWRQRHAELAGRLAVGQAQAIQ
ncbi:MAG: hypothetical protein JO087_07390 [Actinobacteria bacterium]|nr:hypothetical protein [Actinomycetota bacterium]